MFKSVSLPKKQFETKEELFKALKSNKDKILELKKAAIKNSDAFEYNVSEAAKDQNFEEGFIYPVINTTKIIDSHLDFHKDGIWNKSAQDQQGKVHYIINHSLEVGSVIAYPKDVEIQINEMKWSDLGQNYEGTTQALIFKTKLQDYSNKDAANIINSKIPIQGSIRMRYIKIDMAVNSTEKEYVEEKKVWDLNIDQVVNKEVAMENDHFFVVSEAQIWKEGSMVLAGSNHVTPIIYPEETEKGIEELSELNKKALDNPTKENLLHFCNQYKALQEGEAVDKTLPIVEKPQVKINPLFKNLTQLK